MIGLTVLAAGLAYLLGGLPASYWVVRWKEGEDVRLLGSGNPGATNVLRISGVLGALPVLVFDLGKGFLAVLVGKYLELPPAELGAVGAAAVVGHAFPIWLRFRGGKGVATAGGVFAALVPASFVVALAVFAAVIVSTRLVSLASLLSAVIVPIAIWRLGPPGANALVAWSMLIGALILFRHHANVGRLLRGGEPRLGEPRADSS